MQELLTLIQDNIVASLILVPIVTGLVEVAKRAGFPQRFCSLLSLVLGIVIFVALGLSTGFALLPSLLVGVALGLAASGLWEAGGAVRNVVSS